MPARNASVSFEDFEDPYRSAFLRWLGKMGGDYFEDNYGLPLRNLGIPTEQFAMVPARVWIHTQYSASFSYDLLGCTINSQSGVGGVSVLPIVDMYESLAVNEPSKPTHLERVLVLKRKWLRILGTSPGI